MFLRVSTVKRINKSYSYAQIVQSYRREEDGLPAHRVVANLGQLSELEIENLKSAFGASKNNKRVVVAKANLSVAGTKISKPNFNLVYLDLAVLFEIWSQSGIAQILEGALPRNSSLVSVQKILAILCFHRSQDPGSKLSATRWFQTTALPEMTSVSSDSFNNSRLHRALYDLEQANISLRAKLPSLYGELRSDSSALFLDVSDACFCGDGPEMAEKGLSKDGAIRTKIGIVLLCNRDGLPIRWEVVPGASPDSGTMLDTLEEIKGLSWVRDVPLVCDRAMGRTSLIEKMNDMGITFLTAISRTEYVNFAESLNTHKVDFPLDGLAEKVIAERAGKHISAKKHFVKVYDDLFAIDLGHMEICVLGEKSDFRAHMKYEGNRIQTAMHLGREIKKLVENGKFGSVTAAGASLKLKMGIAHKYHNLNRLPQQVQQAILNGEARNCSINRIEQIAIKEKPDSMMDRFYEHVDKCNKLLKKSKRTYYQPRANPSQDSDSPTGERRLSVRVVAYFNPQMFADQKVRAQKWLQKIADLENDLNKRLSSTSSRRTKDSVYAEIDRFMRKKDLLRCFDIKILLNTAQNVKSVQLTLIEDEWNKRRNFDGFCVLVAQSNCTLTATDLCKLYRAKDVVEKDFQVIKSVLQLGPIRHRTDLKVKAHVSICMLSLLIERVLEKRLAGVCSARRALEVLHTCHLNKYVVGSESLYTITEPTPQQMQILKQLRMTHLCDDDYLRERIDKSQVL